MGKCRNVRKMGDEEIDSQQGIRSQGFLQECIESLVNANDLGQGQGESRSAPAQKVAVGRFPRFPPLLMQVEVTHGKVVQCMEVVSERLGVA